LGTKGMIATDNVYPNTAKIYKNGEWIGVLDMSFVVDIIHLLLTITL
jgi:myo-inositol 2-dehydrogenase/D-chiro-inositol 1-dehydrogenase